MKFGIDRLLEEPALRKPLAGRRVALLAHPASVTRDLVHSLDALAALKDIELGCGIWSPARAPRRQAGQHDRDLGLSRPRARDSSVQPLRRSASPHSGDDGRLRCSARRSSGCGLPSLHLHHDPTLRSRSSCGTRQNRLGSRPAQSGRDVPWKGCGSAPVGKALWARDRCPCVTVLL